MTDEDLAILDPAPLTIHLGAREDRIVLTLPLFPVHMTVTMAHFLQDHKDPNVLTVEETVTVVAEMLGRSDSRITEEYLNDHCSERQVVDAYNVLLFRYLSERVPNFKEKLEALKNGKKAEPL